MTTPTTPGAAELAALAEQAAAVTSALRRLDELWAAADHAAPNVSPIAVSGGYPFGHALEEVIAQAAAWTYDLTVLAQTANDPLPAASQAIRTHLNALAADTPGNGQTYENEMRGALGGIIGDVGAAFNEDVQVKLAGLLDTIGGDADPATVRGQAVDLCHAYLAVRSRDFHKH